MPIHVGSSNGSDHKLGGKSGAETVTLSAAQMPSHDHVLKGSSDSATQPSTEIGGNVLGKGNISVYRETGTSVDLNAASIPNVGGGQAHNNMQPYQAVNFCIALQGLFPSRN